ncbi:RNA polymerase sigma-70 factor [Chitinophaga sp. OAE865]|uniref:RNA polymerase sigma factor n=1 Tax=Chitinophaga sp. OAE865 TaxID=2817898 RepID=UPI001AE29785
MTNVEIISGFSIEALKKGDESSFRALFEHLYQPLCYFGVKITGNLSAAEEVTGDCFLKLWHRHKGFESLPAIKSFLYVSIRNGCLNYLKGEKRRVIREMDWTVSQESFTQDNFIDQIIETEVLVEVRQAISTLPEHYRRVLHLAFNEGLKNTEIAERLGLNQSTVDNQKARGIQLLQKVLSRKSFLVLLLILHSGN